MPAWPTNVDFYTYSSYKVPKQLNIKYLTDTSEWFKMFE